MGLDANFLKTKAKISQPVDFSENFDGGATTEGIRYFRKHHDLQGWMENLYRSKGGIKESFNCVPVQLTAEDIDNLENDVKGNNLPETSGFFFGSGNTDYYKEETLQTIEKCRQALMEGYSVFYNSWW